MRRSQKLLKLGLCLFMVIALISCGGSGGGVDSFPPTFGTLNLSGNNTGGTGTVFKATNMAVSVFWLMLNGSNEGGISGAIAFSSLITEEFNGITVEIGDTRLGKNYEYSCDAAIECRGSAVIDTVAKTVTFKNLEVAVNQNPDPDGINSATGPLILNGTLKYG